jgi:hypothetical protein
MFQAAASHAPVTARQHKSSVTGPACCAMAPPEAAPKNVPRN